MFTIKFDEWVHLTCEKILQEISELEDLKEMNGNSWSVFALASFNMQINELFEKREMLLDILNSEQKPIYATMSEDEYFKLRENMNLK